MCCKRLNENIVNYRALRLPVRGFDLYSMMAIREILRNLFQLTFEWKRGAVRLKISGIYNNSAFNYLKPKYVFDPSFFLFYLFGSQFVYTSKDSWLMKRKKKNISSL